MRKKLKIIREKQLMQKISKENLIYKELEILKRKLKQQKRIFNIII